MVLKTLTSLFGCEQQHYRHSRSSTVCWTENTTPRTAMVYRLDNTNWSLKIVGFCRKILLTNLIMFIYSSIFKILDYPVDAFNGKKHFIISTTSWTGGKNNFLGIAYIIIGCICVVLGAIFSFIHIKFGHS